MDANAVPYIRYDDPARLVREYASDGTEVSTRPYTPEEVANAEGNATAATQYANQSEVEANLNEDLDAMQAIIDQTNEDLRTDPSQELKDLARAARRLIRMALEDFSGTE